MKSNVETDVFCPHIDNSQKVKSNNLKQNIEKSLGGNISITEQKAIDAFISTVCKEYQSTISNTNYEKKKIYQIIQLFSRGGES